MYVPYSCIPTCRSGWNYFEKNAQIFNFSIQEKGEWIFIQAKGEQNRTTHSEVIAILSFCCLDNIVIYEFDVYGDPFFIDQCWRFTDKIIPCSIFHRLIDLLSYDSSAMTKWCHIHAECDPVLKRPYVASRESVAFVRVPIYLTICHTSFVHRTFAHS